MIQYIEKGLDKLAKQLDIEFSYTAANHNFELGLPLENALKSFFRPYFPLKYGFGSGYMVDIHDMTSNQSDWIIYDKIYYPPIIAKANISDNVEYYPFDSVYSSIEVKRTLNPDVLNKALSQIETTKRLQRTKAHPTNITPMLDYTSMIPASSKFREIHANYFYTGIYAYNEEDLSDPRLIFDHLNKKQNFDLLPDFIAVHGKYYITKVQNYTDPKCPNCARLTHLPQQYNGFGFIESSEKTSTVFYTRLLNQLNNTFLNSKDFTDSLEKVSKSHSLVQPYLFHGKRSQKYDKQINR